MSIENHEYIDNKNNGINILAKEFWLGNDPKFWDFLNKKIDEILSNDAYNQRHQNCRDNRNSSDFYKYLVLHKRGLINNDLVKNSLERLVKKYRTKNFSEYDCSDICTLFNSYSYFKTKFKLFNINDKSLNKSDCEEFLNSSILNTILTYWGESGNSELYDIITSYDFISRQQFELYDLYKKSNKSRNKLQSWDDFFCNNWENISKEIKRIYDKYAHFDWKKYIENWKKNKIEKSLSFIPANSEFKNFLTDIFYELNDNKYLEKDFISKLFFWSDGFFNFLDYKKIENSFNNREKGINYIWDKKLARERRWEFNTYKENLKKKLIAFIPTFHSSYIKKETLPTFTNDKFLPDNKLWEFKHTYKEVNMGVNESEHKELESSLQLSYKILAGFSTHHSWSPIWLWIKNSLNISNYQPSPSVSAIEPQPINSNWAIQPSPSVSAIEPQGNINQRFWRKTNIQNIIKYIKENDNGFGVAKKTIENKWIYISDEDIFYVILYNCSISKDGTIDPNQKQEAQRILAANPNFSIIWKEIFENIVEGNINIDSQVIALNSNWEDELLGQNENNMRRLNQFLVKTQKEMLSLTNTVDIKEYCKSVVLKIKSLENDYNCENLASEKINTLISSFLNLNNIKDHDDYNTRWLFILYLMLTDYKNIWKINDNNIDSAIDTVFWKWNDEEFLDLKSHRKKNVKSYQEHILQRITKYDQDVLEYNNGVIARYEKARAEAENRKFYWADYINFSRTSDNPQDQTWVQLASRINNLDKKLNNYKLKKPKNEMSEHEKSALMYTAFETTFNNTFNTNDIIVQKLVDLKIDLRSELTNYWIYNKEKNSFDENARNKFVKDRLLNTWFSIEEIETLWKTMKELPNEVEKNYEILCGNFDADQDGFEKISKIYALGEIIDNIRTLFSDLNSKKLWNFMNLQLDEKSPADIIGDCLFIKWKINWAETNIKYDLRTWKVYMNSFTEQILNPPKIIIWNTTPNKEIWDFGSFDDAISNMNSAFMIQNNDSWNFNNLWDTPNDDNDSSENKQDPEDLIKNKLNRDLKSIWKIVNDEVWKQTLENDIINGFLKTFGISSNTWGSKEFVGSSKLYTILNNFINIDNEFELTEISNYMKKILKLLSFSRWEDNQTLSENKLKQNDRSNSYDIESFTIFDIDEKHATEEIKSLQIQTRKFFPNWNGNWWEKNKIGELAHFDEDVNISIINVIVDKCCVDGKLSKKSLENYFEHIHKEIIKNLSESDKATADSWLKEQLEFV